MRESVNLILTKESSSSKRKRRHDSAAKTDSSSKVLQKEDLGKLLLKVIDQLQLLSRDENILGKTSGIGNRHEVSMELKKIKSQLESVRNGGSPEGKTIFSDRLPVVEPYGKFASTISPMQNSLFDNPTSMTNNQTDLFSGRSSGGQKLQNFVQKLSELTSSNHNMLEKEDAAV